MNRLDPWRAGAANVSLAGFLIGALFARAGNFMGRARAG